MVFRKDGNLKNANKKIIKGKVTNIFVAREFQ